MREAVVGARGLAEALLYLRIGLEVEDVHEVLNAARENAYDDERDD